MSKMARLSVFVLTLAVATSVFANQDSIAKVDQGTIQGAKKTSSGGQTYHSFSGIRYAKAPVGKLRFKLPEPSEKWEGTLQAWLPDGYSQIFRPYAFGPSGFWTIAPLR